jgi:protocatechuate 3,4-dioxygenase alpha subunit
MLVFMRGILKPVLTRVYFPDETANASDPVLNRVPEEQRPRLVGEIDGDTLRFDVRMQGEDQTPFFTL